MKVKIEISQDASCEVIIKCREINDEVLHIESLLTQRGSAEMPLYIGDDEYFVPKKDVLFFETTLGKVYAHTRERMYLCPYKLFELEEMLDTTFLRISKSTIVNIMEIGSLHKEITGNGEIRFKRSDKVTYFSRGYAKILKDRIEEKRFGK